MKKLFGVIMGLLFVAVGAVYVLNGLNIFDVSVSLDGWWTAFIIVPSIYGLITSKPKIGSLAFLAFGVYLLLAARDFITYTAAFRIFVPTLLALLGIKIIIKSLTPKKITCKTNSKGKVECVAAFSSRNTDCTGENVANAQIGAIFGASTCNMSNSTLTDSSCINIFCVFGGAELILPENVEIKSNVFSLFGEVSDKRAVNSTEKSTAVTINGFCMFGGVDIK